MSIEKLSEDVSSRQNAWHQSTIDLIGNCSWRYFLTYVMGLPDPSGTAARIGTSVHKAIEHYEIARMNGEALPTAEEMLAVAATLLNDDEPETLATAKIAIGNWMNTSMKDKGPSHREWLSTMTPVDVEGYFNFPLVEGAMPIGGTIDGVYLDAQGLYRVVDLKTAKDMSRWKDSGEGKRLQATMYAVAIQLRFNLDYLPQVTYAVVRSNKSGETAKRVHVQPDFEDVRVLGDKIREAQRVKDTEDYVKNPSWNLCSATWCPHYQGCMVTGELSGTPAKVKQRAHNANLQVSRDAAFGPDSITTTNDTGGIK